MEEIQIYYFALYSKPILHIYKKTNKQSTSKFNHLTFYDKNFYRAHLFPSTYEKFHDDCEKLAKFYDNNYLLKDGEWIEDCNESTIVCWDQETNSEIDAFIYLEERGYTYDWSQSSCTKFAVWTKPI